MSIPWPYRVGTRCTIQPIVKRYSVAPFDGIFEQSFVRTGEAVQANQLLARMDDRELRLKLAELIADRSRARKKHDSSLAVDDVPAAQLAHLEAEKLDLQIRLLRQREKDLELRSPIDGIVLSGDLDDSQGAPVKRGNTLFEIAPVTGLRIEAEIPEEDIASIEHGMRVRAALDGAPGKYIEGEIMHVHPRAEPRDGRNIFVAEVELTEQDELLRPGMSGHARVGGPLRPIGWIWFHKAWQRVSRYLKV